MRRVNTDVNGYVYPNGDFVQCQECGTEGAHLIVTGDVYNWSFRLCDGCEAND